LKIKMNYSKKTYAEFIKNFSDKIKSVDEKTSFFIYGSYLRRDFVPGVSDLDGFLILDDGLVTSKDDLRSLSYGLMETSKLFPKVKFQFNVLDWDSSLDGRFLTYTKDYTDFFKKNAEKICGNFNIDAMLGFMYKSAILNSISHNLSKLRQNFLYYDFNRFLGNVQSIEKTIYSPLGSLARLPKQFCLLTGGQLIESKEDSLEQFKINFPNYMDNGFFKELFSLLKDERKYKDFHNSKGGLMFSLECLTEMEKMIRIYAGKFPVPRDVEIKD